MKFYGITSDKTTEATASHQRTWPPHHLTHPHNATQKPRSQQKNDLGFSTLYCLGAFGKNLCMKLTGTKSNMIFWSPFWIFWKPSTLLTFSIFPQFLLLASVSWLVIAGAQVATSSERCSMMDSKKIQKKSLHSFDFLKAKIQSI